MLSSGEKNAVATIATVALLFVAVVGTTVGVLVATSKSEEHKPYFQLAVGTSLHTVDPVRWCEIDLSKCDPPLNQKQSETPRVDVETGQSVLLSVSKDIAEAPWNLTTLYWTPKGLIEKEDPQASGETFSVTLHSRPNRILLGVTINVASVISSPDGTTTLARGVLAADTSPAAGVPAAK